MHKLDTTFAALADPTRRNSCPACGWRSDGDGLGGAVRNFQPAISRHLKVLEKAGLITRRVDGAKHPRRLSKAGIDAIDQWLGMLREAMAKNYDRLDKVRETMQTEDGEDIR